MKQQFPRLRVATAHGYFESTEEAKRELLNQIRAFAPNVLMVGMGMPLQEHWIAENYDKLGNAVILPCGAAIDYFAGAIPTPPRWAGRLASSGCSAYAPNPRACGSAISSNPGSCSS